MQKDHTISMMTKNNGSDYPKVVLIIVSIVEKLKNVELFLSI